MFDLINEILQTLRTNKLRTALTGFAVAWGIFMLIVLLGMSRGVLNNFTSFASLESSSVINVWPGVTTKPYEGYQIGRQIELENSDRSMVKSRNSEYVAEVRSTVVLDSSNIHTDLDYISGSLYGHFPGEEVRAKLNMKYGRFINRRDMNEQRKVVVLEEKNARQLFGDEAKAVGSRVTAMGLSWLVVGVYSHDWETGTYVPFTTAMALNSDGDKVSEMMVQLKNVGNVEQGETAEHGVREALASAHNFDPTDDGGVYTWNRLTNYFQSLEAMNILQLTVWIIGILTLISGIVGVSNIMFVSVRERTHEIGIRRALGAKPRSIWLQVVAESVSITTLFGYIGIVFGTLVTAIISKLTEGTDFLKDPTINLSTALQVTIVLIVAGALAGLFPAVKATKVKPVEALRYE
ncbi:MAG: ABC transporter permease [Bacteroides sp.]|nr:ABC transporter permease [Bacteroides sp.]MCM1413490.1 ABC transporter permease [Bacteroides sp.]MCM1471299.1 ABC transporter permease [Bacteroides sp.]